MALVTAVGAYLASLLVYSGFDYDWHFPAILFQRSSVHAGVWAVTWLILTAWRDQRRQRRAEHEAGSG